MKIAKQQLTMRVDDPVTLTGLAPAYDVRSPNRLVGRGPSQIPPEAPASRHAISLDDLSFQLLLWISLVLTFCIALVATTRISLGAIIITSLLLPAALLISGRLRFAIPRTGQLFATTSYFMLVAAISFIAISFGWATLNLIAGYAFFGYFALQITGFLVDQAKKRSLAGLASTVFGGSAIILWGASTDLMSGFDGNGLFQIWGENAPGYIQAIYCLWVVQVIVDMRTLPKLSEASAHVISVTVAVFSGQFFFARLLTASQIFMVDGLLRCTDRNFGGSNFLVVRDSSLSTFRFAFRRFASPALLAVLLIIATLSCHQSLSRMGVL